MAPDAIVSALLSRTGASRATVRLRDPRGGFPVAAEALAPGTRSIAGAVEIDPRAGATFDALAGSDRLLVQGDVSVADPPPPPALVAAYGVRAQMVAPVWRDGSLEAIVSVHESAGPRDWTGDDVLALREAVDQVRLLVPSRRRHDIDAGGTG
jgi:maleate isomerase